MLKLVLIVLITRSVINNLWTFCALRKLSPSNTKSNRLNLINGRQLVIILPVFEETALIRRTVDYLANIVRDADAVSVVIVGSAKERDQSLSNPTLTIARIAAAGFSNVRILEDPNVNGWMSHQVNYAVKYLLRSGADPHLTWIYLTNIDSRFSKAAVRAVIDSINSGIPILLQSAVFLSNFRRLSWLLKGLALWQSRWTITHELKRLALHNRCSYFLMHVVGHGLCISLDKFVEYGMLPEDTPTEDLHFGFYLAASAERVKPLQLLELADSPTSISATLKQKYMWSMGPMLYPLYLANYRRRFPEKWRRNWPRAYLLMIQGLFSYLDWLLVSWAVIALLWLSSQTYLAMVLLLVYMCEYLQCNVFFFRRRLISARDLLMSPLWIFVSSVFHSPPANVALLESLKGLSRRYKTPHD
jgi:hypothetical protein